MEIADALNNFINNIKLDNFIKAIDAAHTSSDVIQDRKSLNEVIIEHIPAALEVAGKYIPKIRTYSPGVGIASQMGYYWYKGGVWLSEYFSEFEIQFRKTFYNPNPINFAF